MQLQLSFVLLLPLVYGWARLDNRIKQRSLQYGYDYLVLSINWTPSICRTFLKKDSEITCSPCKSAKAINKWNIHGFWPSKMHERSPFECSNVTFNSNLLSDKLKKQLTLNWPNVFDRNDAEFWAYEWKKHGTCLANINSLSEYFSITIQLFEQYKIDKILREAAILPNENYQLENIQRVFKNILGVNVFISCVHNKASKQQFLSEFRLCFNKSYELADCSEYQNRLSNCKPNEEITYFESC